MEIEPLFNKSVTFVMNLSEIFTTREIAYIILGIAAITVILIFLKRDKENLLSVIKRLFTKNFIPVYIITILYTIAAALLLNKIGIWDTSQVKDTGLWMVFVGLPLLYQITQAKDLKNFFKSIISDSFQFTVFLEFIMGLHTFNLWIELVIAFVASFLALLIMYAEQDEKNKAVTVLFKRLSYIITACMFLAILNYIYHHFKEYQDWSYLKQFALPFALTILFAPMLYLFVVYVRFEDMLYLVLNRKVKSPKLRRYAVLKVLIHFLTDLEGLKRWRNHAMATKIRNRADVNSSILHIKNLQCCEQSPISIEIKDGWSPYEAKDFMSDQELSTGFYILQSDNDWFAISDPKLLSEQLPTSLCYTVKGNKTTVTELELCLKVFKLADKGNLHEVFLDHMEVLYYKVCQNELPLAVIESVLTGLSYQAKESGLKLVISKEEFNNGYHGYQLEFKIQHENHK